MISSYLSNACVLECSEIRATHALILLALPQDDLDDLQLKPQQVIFNALTCLNSLSCCHIIEQPPICFDKWKCDCGSLAMQGTLPPPYSSSVPGGANGSLSSPVSTMTSQSSTSSSSLAKQRQSWLDLVSQAAPSSATCAEAAVVCAAQVHSRQPTQGSVDEVEAPRVSEGPSGCANRKVESNGGDSSSEEDEVQAGDCDAQEDEEGEVFFDVMC